MTITLYWWMGPLALFAAPFVWDWLRPQRPAATYFPAFDFEAAALMLVCWTAAFTWFLVKILS